MRVETVYIVRHPKCWWDAKFSAMGNYVYLEDGSGEKFYNTKDEIRKWKYASGAKQFLRRTAKKYGSFGYRVIDQRSGKETLITPPGYIPDEDKAELGPHAWQKANAVTISDKSGMYDVWKCTLCRVQEKRYGLSGRPTGGYCSKNPK